MLGFVVIISPWKSCQPRLFNEDKMAQQTPLYEQHTLCGARMVDFHGWMMPLHYGSQSTNIMRYVPMPECLMCHI